MATPYDIRLELLKMSKELLMDNYYTQLQAAESLWNSQVNYVNNINARVTTPLAEALPVPDMPKPPKFSTTTEIMEQAQKLNMFVSMVPGRTETKKN